MTLQRALGKPAACSGPSSCGKNAVLGTSIGRPEQNQGFSHYEAIPNLAAPACFQQNLRCYAEDSAPSTAGRAGQVLYVRRSCPIKVNLRMERPEPKTKFPRLLLFLGPPRVSRTEYRVLVFIP